MFDITLGAHSPDDIAHIIQVSLAPAFILAGLAQMLNVFSARLARIADKVNATARDLDEADPAEARHLSQQLSYLRRRTFVLDTAVVCVSLRACLRSSAVRPHLSRVATQIPPGGAEERADVDGPASDAP
ncbi:DUF2721 domain-containing protein [Methylobacterium sp. NEAU 140]|uniref:DUF2721 domain-containing protein n=1 Tax=Methylobacterium sp. NEAU 140 TaxID=3064945 RepID=UPI002734EBB9|nr:DUF2721 domain-containing protein [Methylobacterium sp. NEAU 140]MDP4027283.1 DUF2721 domain-containing protein [Methylobacterium sp. NEAU 140]